MLLSIVTVVRNDPAVAATVASVLAQEGVDVESVVVDGASTDGTLAALEPYRGRIRLLSEPDKGIYDGMNKGLALARGRVVSFLNAGDVLLGREGLARVAQAFQEDPALGACFAGLEIADGQGRVKRRWPASAHRPGSFARGWMPSHPTFFALREPLTALGGFDTQYRLAADYDLMLRALEQARLSSRVLPGTLVRMRSGGASQASLKALFRHNREAWAAARAAGVVRAPLALFLARKWGRKIPQLMGGGSWNGSRGT